MKEALEIGKLLRASITGCVVGCAVTQIEAPQFGGMVRIPLEAGYQVFGLIYDIHIDDDGLVRQLVTAREPVSREIIEDNRLNRNVPVEISVLFSGYEQDGRIFHLLPPHPPLTLDTIYPCSPTDITRFTQAGRFGYFRHVLRAQDLPTGELLAAHLKQAGKANQGQGNSAWINQATQELIVLLRDDYPTLMSVLGAIAEIKE
ncbi:MAG TPA: hypothetical protein VF313_08455 [Anaerolineaceae bacterium]|jgi:hypothetical protein